MRPSPTRVPVVQQRRHLSRSDSGSPDPGWMAEATGTLFDVSVWEPALERFGAVVHLSLAVYGANGRLACGPRPATPIVALFDEHGYDPGIFAECARACLTQPTNARPPVVVGEPAGLGAVGISLLLGERIVGAIVGGYAVASVRESVAMARFARTTGLSVQKLTAVARSQPTARTRSLLQHGALLQVLADTLLRENDIRRHSEKTALRLAHLASHDTLTALPNRALLADRLARALALARRHHRRMAVLVLDVDRFKHVNDSLGHQLGDDLLRVVAREMTQCVRDADTVGRQGGDEFVVVLSELERTEDAAAVARKIIAAFRQPHTLAGHELCVSVSIGISVFEGENEDAAMLLNRADIALYHAKDQGRGCYKFFQAGMNEPTVNCRSIVAGLDSARGTRGRAVLQDGD